MSRDRAERGSTRRTLDAAGIASHESPSPAGRSVNVITQVGDIRIKAHRRVRDVSAVQADSFQRPSRRHVVHSNEIASGRQRHRREESGIRPHSRPPHFPTLPYRHPVDSIVAVTRRTSYARPRRPGPVSNIRRPEMRKPGRSSTRGSGPPSCQRAASVSMPHQLVWAPASSRFSVAGGRND